MMKNLRKFMLTKYILLACIFAGSAYTTPMNREKIEKQIKNYEKYALSHEMLAYAIRDMEIQHPEWAYRQAMLESGSLSSRLTRRQNNLFGMKMPRKRDTFASAPGSNRYAKYDTWAHSVADYKLYQGEKEIKDYKKFLKSRKYSETNNYVDRLNAIKIPDNILKILHS
jgi:uncharacterized FlgJ-related protein